MPPMAVVASSRRRTSGNGGSSTVVGNDAGAHGGGVYLGGIQTRLRKPYRYAGDQQSTATPRRSMGVGSRRQSTVS